MGSTFSGLDKHGNCYSFGVFPVSNSAQQIRPSISTHPSGLTCNACRQQTDVSTAFRQRPAHSYQHGHNTSDITLSTLGTSVTSEEVLDEQTGRADFTWQLRPERLHQSASSPRTLFTQEALQSHVHRVGIVHATQCGLVDDNAQGHGVQLREKGSSWTSDIVNASLTYTTGVANSVSRHVAQFHSLIHKWSNTEIAQLCSQFDFLLRVKNASFASADARPKSPTLEDDLKSLCANGWCCNLRLSYGGSLHGVHSYVLAARSTAFFELLNAVYSLPFPARISACPSSILTLVLPVSSSFEEHLADVPPHTSPDVLPTTISQRCWVKSAPSTPETEPNLRSNQTPPSKSKLRSPAKTLSNRLLALYSGADTLTDESSQSWRTPTSDRQKPDLLCLSTQEVPNQSTNLLAVYYELDRTSKQTSPFSPDCRLIFSCGSSASVHFWQFPCHAGLLAARSQFLRRILLRRHFPPSPGFVTTIVLDGSVLKPHFAPILLHFIYSDWLNTEAIACMYLPKQQHVEETGAFSIECPESAHQSAHIQWHEDHHGHDKSVQPCCSQIAEHPVQDFANLAQPVSGTRVIPLHEHKRGIRFCFQCPFCLIHVLELHSVGQLLEFPRFSEACEDLVIRSMELPVHATATAAGAQPSQSHNHQSPKMTPISLAVGLLHWTNVNDSRSSPILSGGESPVHAGDKQPTECSSPSYRSTADCLEQQKFLSQCIQTTESGQSLLSGEGASTRYLCRRAVQYLREHFTALVRAPGLLRRLTPQHLRELISSDLVQAPESEILAALLSWSEQRIQLAHSDFAVNWSRSASYLDLVSNLTETPLKTAYYGQQDGIGLNPWLLLIQSDEVQLPNERRDSTDNRWCANSTLGASLSAQCELCRVSPEARSLSVIDHEPVNLNAIVKVLDQYQLLDLLRPAHLLHPLPLGLATVILQYQLDQGQAKTTSSQPTDILINQHASKAETIRSSPWLPLLTTSMMLLPLSPQANKNQPIRSVHPYLKSKLGGGPLAYIPLQAPAQVASVSAWLPPPKSSIHLDNLHSIISQCECQWSLPEEHYKSVGVGLKTASDPATKAPRLFHPFVEEAYSMLNATSTQADGFLSVSSSVNTHCTCVKRLTTVLSRPCEFDARTSSSTHPQKRRIGFGHSIAESQHPCGIPRSAAHFLSEARQFHSSGMSSQAVPTGTCCGTECKEFAYSLLTAMQWSQLISRYLELVQRFKAGINGGEIYFNPMELLRVFRLHCLREKGLPDSLHVLLTCRINDYVQEIHSNVLLAFSTTNEGNFNVNAPGSTLESTKTEFDTGRPRQEAATSRTPDLEEALQGMCLDARMLPDQMAAGHSHSSRNNQQYVDCESEDGVSGIECIACQQPQLVVDTWMDSEETRLLAHYPSPRYHNVEGRKKRNPINAHTRRCHHHSQYRNHQPPSCMCAISPPVAPSFESQAIQSTCLMRHHSHGHSHAFSRELFIRAGYLDNSNPFINRRKSRRQPRHVSQSTGSTGTDSDGAHLCIRTQPPHCFCTHLPKSATSLVSSMEYADYIDPQHDILKYHGAPSNADHDTCLFRNKHRVCSSSPFSTCSSYASSSDLSESSKCGTDLSDTASAGEYSFPFTVDDN